MTKRRNEKRLWPEVELGTNGRSIALGQNGYAHRHQCCRCFRSDDCALVDDVLTVADEQLCTLQDGLAERQIEHGVVEDSL